MLKLIRALLITGLGASLLIVALGLPNWLHPAFDSFSHFRLHFVVLTALFASGLAIMTRGQLRLFTTLSAIASLTWIGVLYLEGPPNPQHKRTGQTTAHAKSAGSGPSSSTNIRLVQFNLNYRNSFGSHIAGMLRTKTADVVALQEVTPRLFSIVRSLTDIYPNQTSCHFNNVGGVMILSKHPFVGGSIVCQTRTGFVAARIRFPSGEATVASIHTYWPWPLRQHSQITGWLKILPRLKPPFIIAGDFNAAPWSYAVKRVASASNTNIVPGLRTTIRVDVLPPLPAIPIQIDHALLSDEFCARSVMTGPDTGSDHLPVTTDITRDQSGCR